MGQQKKKKKGAPQNQGKVSYKKKSVAAAERPAQVAAPRAKTSAKMADLADSTAWQIKERDGYKLPADSSDAAMATAPYNFISLLDSVLPAPLDGGLDWRALAAEERYSHYRDYIAECGKFSGELELAIEAVTPLFIGGDSRFFSPLGRPVIPGSTLRGLTKNLVKIVTCGSMQPGEDILERNLYYRAIAGNDRRLRKNYQENMLESKRVGKPGKEKNINVSKARGGFLVHRADGYHMVPANLVLQRIPEGEYASLEYNTAAINWNYDAQSADIITAKAIKEKKHYLTIEKADWNDKNWLEVPDQVIESYRADKSKGRYDLLSEYHARTQEKARGFTHRDDIDLIVPCCYVADGTTVRHFGHGRYYRITYNHSIGDHVPTGLKTQQIDFATAMFGDKELWAGRVFFDDARLEGTPVALTREMPRPLMQPNPTSYQLYLEQTEGTELKHWDNDARLRGYKMYWHQQGEDNWRIASGSPIEGMHEIQPLAAGSKFTGRIRFRNLAAEELGALLAVFSLGTGSEDICYKIGYGKSIGLGSVRIETRLRLDDTQARYQQLLSAEGWSNSLLATDGREYIDSFERYRARMLPAEQENIAHVLAELRCMLDYNNAKQDKWAEKVALMPIEGDTHERYKNRVVLKPALDFVRESYR